MGWFGSEEKQSFWNLIYVVLYKSQSPSLSTIAQIDALKTDAATVALHSSLSLSTLCSIRRAETSYH